MKIAKFINSIEKDYNLRAGELNTLIEAINLNGEKNKRINMMILRSGILLIYSHWEGFIKSLYSLYLKYIGNKTLKYYKYDLIETYIKSNSCEMLIANIRHPKKIKFNDNLIDAKSNLNTPIFIDLSKTIGINVEDIAEAIKNMTFLKRKNNEDMIDHLLKYRNQIAHGTTRTISYTEFKKFYENILQILTMIKEKIINEAKNKGFKS